MTTYDMIQEKADPVAYATKVFKKHVFERFYQCRKGVGGKRIMRFSSVVRPSILYSSLWCYQKKNPNLLLTKAIEYLKDVDGRSVSECMDSLLSTRSDTERSIHTSIW